MAKRKPSGKKGKEVPKDKALDGALDQIHRQFGQGAIMKLGEGNVIKTEAISTGAFSLDIALGVGGVPKGRIVEVFGPEASGKTTLSLHVVANAQKSGGVAAFIDAEHALDPSYARRLGVQLDDLLVSQPDSGEQALQIAELLVKSNAVDVVVVDSVAALVPKAELEGEIGDTHVGLQARLMSQALRKLSGSISRSKTCVVFINQIREKIGVMFGSPLTTPGGRALKFYSSVRLEIRRIGSIKEAEKAIGNVVRVKVVKNKVAPPFRTAEFDIMFNQGISWEGSVIDLALSSKLIEKSGAWFSYGSTRLGQGREKSKLFLAENPDVRDEIEARLRAEHQVGEPVEEMPADEKPAGDGEAEAGAEAGASE